jgi:hypothetical protein
VGERPSKVIGLVRVNRNACSTQPESAVDFQKPEAYKHDPRLHYVHAIFIELQVGAEPGGAQAVWVD